MLNLPLVFKLKNISNPCKKIFEAFLWKMKRYIHTAKSFISCIYGHCGNPENHEKWWSVKVQYYASFFIKFWFKIWSRSVLHLWTYDLYIRCFENKEYGWNLAPCSLCHGASKYLSSSRKELVFRHSICLVES